MDSLNNIDTALKVLSYDFAAQKEVLRRSIVDDYPYDLYEFLNGAILTMKTEYDDPEKVMLLTSITDAILNEFSKYIEIEAGEGDYMMPVLIDGDFWSEKGMRDHPGWEVIRLAAKAACDTLSIDTDVCSLEQLVFSV